MSCIEVYKAHPATRLSANLTVRYLQQLHNDGTAELASLVGAKINTLSQNALSAIEHSQFNIAQRLMKENDPLVFDEALSFNEGRPYTRASFADGRESTFNRVQNAFPNGFPKEMEHLTQKQWEILREEGAISVLVILGYLKSAYGTSTLTDLEFLKAATSMFKAARFANEGDQQQAAFYKMKEEVEVFWNREIAAIESIRKIVQESNPAPDGPIEVFLIFGGAHNFSRHFENSPAKFIQEDVQFIELNEFAKIPD